jgi:hypothetical protein
MTTMRSLLLAAPDDGHQAAVIVRSVLACPDTVARDATTVWRDILRVDPPALIAGLGALRLLPPPWCWLEAAHLGFRFGALVCGQQPPPAALRLLPSTPEAFQQAPLVAACSHWSDTGSVAQYRAASFFALDGEGRVLDSHFYGPAQNQRVVGLQLVWILHALDLVRRNPDALSPLAAERVQ